MRSYNYILIAMSAGLLATAAFDAWRGVGLPCWLLCVLSYSAGALLVFGIADERDRLRREAGLLRDM